MRTAGLVLVAALLPLIAYAAVVNINTANATLLDTLPGVGPSKAAAIIDYRTKNGPFAVIEDIQKVSGIGPVTFENMKAQITVGTADTVAAPTQSMPPAPAPVQPQVPAQSSHTVQTVTSVSQSAHDTEAVSAAPIATNTVAMGAAALPPTDEPAHPNIFTSPWTLGFIGMVLLAAGAFIFI